MSCGDVRLQCASLVLQHHTFYNELSVAPEEHPTMVTDSPLASAAQRAEGCKRVMEEFNTPAYAWGNSATLALFSTGRTTGGKEEAVRLSS